MDIVNIVIPIVASILGGLVSGLFTYLGVKMTILNDRELKKQEIYEKNKETNKAIIQNRPELKVVDQADTIIDEINIYVLPYIKPMLTSQEDISFDYSSLKINDKFWNCKKVIITNCGNKAIEVGFLELKYKSNVNIYTETDFKLWKLYFPNYYYYDKASLPDWLYPNENFKLNIFYPKEDPHLINIEFNSYFIDENDNYWYQKSVNLHTKGIKSIPISEQEYDLHSVDFFKWFIYDHMYFDTNIEKCFDTRDFKQVLQKRKENLWEQEEEYKKFKSKVKNGEILLNS